MKKILPISRRLNKDIDERISSTLSHVPVSEAEAKRMVGLYLEGNEPESEDPLAMIAFNMVKVEIDRGMERSRKARMRAKEARRARETKTANDVCATQVSAEPAELTEEEKRAEKLRRLTATKRSLCENMDEVRRLLYHEAYPKYEELKKQLWVKAKEEQKKRRHERPYFNPPEFSNYINSYIKHRITEIEHTLK